MFSLVIQKGPAEPKGVPKVEWVSNCIGFHNEHYIAIRCVHRKLCEERSIIQFLISYFITMSPVSLVFGKIKFIYSFL